MNARLQRFWGDERGAEAVEWAAVTAVLVMATVPMLLILRRDLLEMFRQAFALVQKAPGEPQYP